MRHSLRNWGYIASAWCASCPRVETIDYCFLSCGRVKSVCIHCIPLLSALLTCPFLPICAYVFFYQFPDPGEKNRRLLLFILKSILYGIWKFRNKATFHKGKEKSRGIIRYVSDLSGLIPLFVIIGITITLFFSLIDYVVNISYDPVLGTF